MKKKVKPMTQEAFARRIGRHRNTIKRWVKEGTRKAPGVLLQRVMVGPRWCYTMRLYRRWQREVRCYVAEHHGELTRVCKDVGRRGNAKRMEVAKAKLRRLGLEV